MNDIIQIKCPICGNKRLIDASERCIAELKPKSEVTSDWIPDFYQKCRICKQEIAIRKVS